MPRNFKPPPTRVPTWLSRLDEAIAALEALSDPMVERQQLELLLHVKSRRAQQLMQPVATRQVGRSLMAHRDSLIVHLRKIQAGDGSYYERNRQEAFARTLAALRQEHIERPSLPVEVPANQPIWNTRMETLPEGVSVGPGEIRVEATNYQEAAVKLLALAMAMAHINPFEMDELLSLKSTA